MNLQHRIHILSQLGKYILDDNEAWNATKQRASQANAWFTPEFIEYALWQISNSFLDEKKLVEWINKYDFNPNESHPRNVGIVMAGNIPLVGFHDFLCAFVAGHHMSIKLSSKDDVLLPFLVQKMQEWEPALKEKIQFAAMLKGDAAWAARILGVRDAVSERTGATVVVRQSLDDLIGLGEREVRTRLGPDRWAAAYAAGRQMSIDSLFTDIDDALAHRGRA